MQSEARDIYIKSTVLHTGRETITEHRVWDAEKFLSARQKESQKETEKPYAIQLSSRAEYLAKKNTGPA